MQTPKARINELKDQIKDLETYLPYADHGAYGQDLVRIRKLKEELLYLLSNENNNRRSAA